jgi:hypothetical protein
MTTVPEVLIFLAGAAIGAGVGFLIGAFLGFWLGGTDRGGDGAEIGAARPAPSPSPGVPGRTGRRRRNLAGAAAFTRMGKKPPVPSASERPSQPVTLGGMRVLGVRSVYVTCSACGYASTVNVDDWEDDVFITSFGPYVKCAKCGHLGAVVRPDWTELPGTPEARRTEQSPRPSASAGRASTRCPAPAEPVGASKPEPATQPKKMRPRCS